jgi:hypothetical protein
MEFYSAVLHRPIALRNERTRCYCRLGRQERVKGVQLVGATPSVVEHEVLQYAELEKLGVSAGTTGLTNIYELGLTLHVIRLGDSFVSSPTFATRQWMDGAR